MAKEQLHCSKCRGPNDRKGQRYCKACHAGNMRANRPTIAEMTPEAAAKVRCRNRTHYRISTGALKPQPCATCGSERVEAHHPDYTNDMLVVWYCRPCHLAHHDSLKPEKMAPRVKVPAREALKQWMRDMGV